MSGKFSEFLKKHPRLNYLQRCLRHSGDPYFVNVVNAIDRDPDLLCFEHRGKEHPEIYFYDIYLDFPSKGFFALFNQTLDVLRYADRFRLTPVVTWSDRCLYKEDVPVNRSENPFCYFFEPVSPFERWELNEAKHYLAYRGCQRYLDVEHPFTVVSKTIVENHIYDRYIQENGEIYAKYIRLKEPVRQAIAAEQQSIGFEGRVLGVHVRATDFKKSYVNHAVAVECNEYIEAVRKAMEEHAFDKIFLATDEADVVDSFQQEFNSRVIYCWDVLRSEDGTAVHFSQNARELHRYHMGVEVIRDMILLSRCDGLIGGHSNVCIAAQIARAAAGTGYSYLNIIDKGFVTKGITTYQDHF